MILFPYTIMGVMLITLVGLWKANTLQCACLMSTTRYHTYVLYVCFLHRIKTGIWKLSHHSLSCLACRYPGGERTPDPGLESNSTEPAFSLHLLKNRCLANRKPASVPGEATGRASGKGCDTTAVKCSAHILIKYISFLHSKRYSSLCKFSLPLSLLSGTEVE